ncbi:zinc ABC transporter substrate-binding protein [Cereibacter sediminicola]|uniref:zinc ABC transporter substrate-binding protein n=1 Tax=Cereibacter sediminicola TaxID=2584941 RepID=UPI0011A51B19|nr:zinc ABC transporter substrate-binding protein [Cereibacter sediminicola]
MRYTIPPAVASLIAAPALAEVPRVVTDLPPVHSLVAQVMGDLGQPTLLLDRGADAHSFQLRPSQAKALADADLVVWVGPEMTRWLDRALAGRTGEEIRLSTLEGTHRQDFGDTADHDHDHDHDHAGEHNHSAEEHAHDDEHGHEGHSHEGLDPHLWLDPANARQWLAHVADVLADLDPANAATYAANAEAARADVDALDTETAQRLEAARGQPFYVFHDAYGYFASHYGLTIAGSISAGDAASPGAAHLSELRAAISDEPRCIFPEVQHDPRLVQQIAEDTGARIGPPLDPSGSSMEPGPRLYGDLIRGLADGILSCVAP